MHGSLKDFCISTVKKSFQLKQILSEKSDRRWEKGVNKFVCLRNFRRTLKNWCMYSTLSTLFD